jgi:hypothetical protein
MRSLLRLTSTGLDTLICRGLHRTRNGKALVVSEIELHHSTKGKHRRVFWPDGQTLEMAARVLLVQPRRFSFFHRSSFARGFRAALAPEQDGELLQWLP